MFNPSATIDLNAHPKVLFSRMNLKSYNYLRLLCYVFLTIWRINKCFQETYLKNIFLKLCNNACESLN